MSMKLNIIIGSTRPGRVGPTVADWIGKIAREHGQFDVEFVDLKAFDLPILDEPSHPARREYTQDHTKKWSASVASGDAYVFVTPEYDFFPPASLVNAVQVLMVEWNYKPAAIVSYGGISGGLRSAQVLRQLLGNVNVHAIPQTVPLPFVNKLIGDDGILTASEQSVEGARQMLSELHKWSTALTTLRA